MGEHGESRSAIYGYLPGAKGDAPERALEVRPALTWKATILHVKDVPEGSLIGYNGTFGRSDRCGSRSSRRAMRTACRTVCRIADR